MENTTSLVINCIGSANLGRCYNSATYEVLSHHPLRDETVRKLWEIGVLGCGQECRLLERSTKSKDSEIVRINDVETQTNAPIYRAVVEIRCDSGD